MKQAILALAFVSGISIACGRLIGVSVDEIDCSIVGANVTASASATAHTYRYDMNCSYIHTQAYDSDGNPVGDPSYTRDYPTAHVRAAFSSSSHSASESLDDGQSKLEVSWICATDPWTADPRPSSCLFGTASAQPTDEGLFDLSHSTYPFSAAYLDAAGYVLLKAALQRAAVTPTPTPFIPVLSRAPLNAGSVLAAAEPDLAVTRISQVDGPSEITSGFNITYEIAVANLGAATSSNIEVTVAAGGAFQSPQFTQTPDGFTCSSVVDCVGPIAGSSDSPANADLFRVQVYAASSGTGTITANVDPKRLVADRDRSNNSKSVSSNVK